MLLGNHHMEHDGFSDKSEREAHDDWDAAVNENGSRLTEESDVDQSDEPSPGPQATAYVEQSTEEMAEVSAEIIARMFLSWRLSLIPLHGVFEQPGWPRKGLLLFMLTDCLFDWCSSVTSYLEVPSFSWLDLRYHYLPF